MSRWKGPKKTAATPCTRCESRGVHHDEIEQMRAGHWLCSRCDADYHDELGEWELATVADADDADELYARMSADDRYTQRAESGWSQ